MDIPPGQSKIAKCGEMGRGYSHRVLSTGRRGRGRGNYTLWLKRDADYARGGVCHGVCECIYIYIYIYIQRDRERERGR